MALFASQITLSRDRHHTFRKTAITWQPDRLQTPSLCTGSYYCVYLRIDIEYL